MIDYHFDCFRLFSRERRLERSGAPVKLGHRALDILFALVERAGEVVPKCDLMARAWPSTYVDENSLRVQIAGLRKALDGNKTAVVIQNVPGRGYCFTLPVQRLSPLATLAEREDPPSLRDDLPPALGRVIGRDGAIEEALDRVSESRLVTIVGPGGVGKTTVAIAVAQRLRRDVQGTLLFVDLGSLPADSSIAASLAARLRQPEIDGSAGLETTPGARNRRTWLVLDGCEHLLADVAEAAERILASAPHIRILATSREALRAAGECVVQLGPLRCPPDQCDPLLYTALNSPALSLLAERAGAASNRFELNQANIGALSEICRKLDGNPLALEIAGAHAALHGPDATLSMLDSPESLMWRGRRTAPTRQRCLEATLDWSYQLLSATERMVLQRLGVFSAPFERSAALAVVTDAVIGHKDAAAALDALIAKSLVATAAGAAKSSFRLSLITRLYALERLSESPCAASVHERRARCHDGSARAAGEDLALEPPCRVFRVDVAGQVAARATTAAVLFHTPRALGASRPIASRTLAASTCDTK